MKKKKPAPLEKQIERAILDYLNVWLGYFAWKNHTTGIYSKERRQYLRPTGKYALRGVSDIICVTPTGKVVFIEVKSAKGRVSDEQKEFISRVAECNGYAFVARSIDDVIDYYKENDL